MFGVGKTRRAISASGQELQAQGLSDDLKRKISEVHLRIRGGDLSPQEMALAEAELEKLKSKLETRMIRISAESAVRPAHP